MSVLGFLRPEDQIPRRVKFEELLVNTKRGWEHVNTHRFLLGAKAR